MPSVYLSQADIIAFGVPNATAAQVAAASNLVDAYIQRPAGLQWMPDYAGLPCYMAALTPSISISLPSPITPGLNVVITLPGGGLTSVTGSVGTVVILERASTAQGKANNCEACVISAVAGNTVTLASVALSHAAGTSMDFGLTLFEQKTLPAKRAIVRLASWPLARVHSGTGSYRYGRRNDQQAGFFDDRNLLAIQQVFGGPPAWQPWSVAAADFNPQTCEVWIPTGIQLAYYSDVRVWYVAGHSQANLPNLIKQATANAILANINTADMAGGIKMARAGDTALTRFSNSALDDDMRAQLNLYKPRLFV